jgi:hypothetical protein
MRHAGDDRHNRRQQNLPNNSRLGKQHHWLLLNSLHSIVFLRSQATAGKRPSLNNTWKTGGILGIDDT